MVDIDSYSQLYWVVVCINSLVAGLSVSSLGRREFSFAKKEGKTSTRPRYNSLVVKFGKDAVSTADVP